MTIKVLTIADDTFLPAVHGGSIALRNDCMAICAAGMRSAAIVSHSRPVQATGYWLTRMNFELLAFQRRRGFVRATRESLRQPYQVTSRNNIPKDVLRPFIDWAPDIILAHHEWSLPTARRIAASSPGSIIVLRSQNDEVAFFRALRDNATGLKKYYFWLESLRLRRWFKRDRLTSTRVALTLSNADNNVYNDLGVPTVVVPPGIDFPKCDRVDVAKNQKEILFVGSLDMPQAVDGLNWYLKEVWPRIAETSNEAKMTIVGRRPALSLMALAESLERVTVIADAPSLDGFYTSAALFVNPVFRGSGVNMKIGEPASYGIPIVTTSFGSRGLEHLAGGIITGDTPKEFAGACLKLLNDSKLRGTLGLSARHGADKYSINATGESFRATFADLLS